MPIRIEGSVLESDPVGLRHRKKLERLGVEPLASIRLVAREDP